jgi:hypothetical protein
MLLSASLCIKSHQIGAVKRPTKNRAYLQGPEFTQDSLEISVIKIESLERLNQ